jgi:hypothetical protein
MDKTRIARTVDGEKIGTFENRKAAVRAFFQRKREGADAGTLTVEG